MRQLGGPMAADDALSSDGNLSGYRLPQRALLDAQEERNHAARIQQILERVTEYFSPLISPMVEAIDSVTINHVEIHAVVRNGLRTGIVSYLTDADGEHSTFRKKTVNHVRDHLTNHLRDTATTPSSADHEPVLRHFDDAAFDIHFPATTPCDAVLSQAILDLAEPLNTMTEANMRLVLSLARTHRGRGPSIEDLWQIGALALREAALSFDPELGAFGTWAQKVIRNRLSSSKRTGQGTKDHMARQVQEFRVEERRLAHELSRSPTPDEVCGSLSLTEKQSSNVCSVLRALVQHPLPEERDDLPTPAAIDRAASPDSQASRREENALLAAALARLTPEEREVVNLRYYLHRPTLVQVAVELGLSEPQVRRRHKSALVKLERALGKVLDAVPNKELA